MGPFWVCPLSPPSPYSLLHLPSLGTSFDVFGLPAPLALMFGVSFGTYHHLAPNVSFLASSFDYSRPRLNAHVASGCAFPTPCLWPHPTHRTRPFPMCVVITNLYELYFCHAAHLRTCATLRRIASLSLPTCDFLLIRSTGPTSA